VVKAPVRFFLFILFTSQHCYGAVIPDAVKTSAASVFRAVLMEGRTEVSAGSAFLVHDGFTLVTARHLFEDTQEVSLKLADNKGRTLYDDAFTFVRFVPKSAITYPKYPEYQVREDSLAGDLIGPNIEDLVVIRLVRKMNARPLTIAGTPGADRFAVGFGADKKQGIVSERLLSFDSIWETLRGRLEDKDAEIQSMRAFLLLGDSPTPIGFSGGPLLDNEGKVTSITLARNLGDGKRVFQGKMYLGMSEEKFRSSLKATGKTAGNAVTR
jgi:Trypsin-like peptidase domain